MDVEPWGTRSLAIASHENVERLEDDSPYHLVLQHTILCTTTAPNKNDGTIRFIEPCRHENVSSLFSDSDGHSWWTATAKPLADKIKTVRIKTECIRSAAVENIPATTTRRVCSQVWPQSVWPVVLRWIAESPAVGRSARLARRG